MNRAGTSYADITGETDWVRQMIDRFDASARQTGATILSFAGHDCIPWEVSVEVGFSLVFLPLGICF